VSKYIDSNDPGVESQLEKDISKLSESGIDLLEKVLDYADIEEITFEEFNDQESESSEDEENITMRMNRGQEKNMTAMAVLKQIKAKLEGRDNSDRSRITVQEQVHGLIMEATSTEKLALMYEGWMAWI
jgi:phosphatidylinositol kinase/protein kinase (PI-3  family)